MTIASTTNRVSYTGNGATSVYAYTFKIFAEGDLLVTVKDTATPPVETTLTITTDYTVSGVGETSGGNVTLVNAGQSWLDGDGDLLTNYTLVIRRVVDLLQNTDIRNQGSFFPETHEDEFDLLVMADQQQQDELDRSLKLPESVTSAAFDPTLPTDIATVDGVLIVNSSGNAFEIDTSIGTGSKQVSVSSNDTSKGYLNGKLVSGSNIAFTENNDGAAETLTIALDTITGLALYDTSADHTYTVTVSELAANRNILLPLLTGDDEFTFNSHTQVLSNKTFTLPQINDTSADHQYVFAVNELAADRTVTLPLLTGNDEFTFNSHTQVLSNKTLTLPQINDTSADHQYVFAVNELAADRTVTLPLLTGNDEFVFKDHAVTMANKTLNAGTVSNYLLFADETTPSAPASGYNQLYFKNDDKLYKQNSAGTESEIGAGGAGGDADQIDLLSADDETDVTGWDTTGSDAVFDNGGAITADSLTLDTNAGNLLSGTTNVFSYDPDANGQNDFFARTISVPKGWRGRHLGIKFLYKTGSTYVDEDFDLVIKDDTNATILQTEAINKRDVTDDTGADYVTNFYCPSDCAALVIGFQNTSTTTTIEFYVDRFELTANPFVIADFDNTTDWTDYIPTISGFGSETGVAVRYKRVGDLFIAQGEFTSGTVAGTEAQIGLLSGLTIKSPHSNTQVCGVAIRGQSVNNHPVVLATAGDSYVNLGLFDSGGLDATVPLNGNQVLASTTRLTFQFQVQVNEWSSKTEHVVTPTRMSQPARASTNDTTAIATVTETYIGFTTDFDDDGLFTNSGSSNNATYTSTTYYTAAMDCKLRVGAQVRWQDADLDQDELMEIFIAVNGVAVRRLRQETWATLTTPSHGQAINDIIEVSKNDKVSIGVYHNAGADVSLEGTSTNSWFTVEQIDTVPVLGAIPKTDALSCEAYASSTQTSNSGAYVDVVLGATNRDISSMVNTGTGEITIQETGWYDLSAQLWFTTNASGGVTSVATRILKNGSTAITYNVDNVLTTNTSYVHNHSKSVYLSASDTLKFQFAFTTANNTTMQSGENATYFTVKKSV